MMKCFRSVLVGFVVIACFFLTGFKKHTPNHEKSTKNHLTIKEAKQQKPLDLTVPLRNVSLEYLPEILAIGQGESTEALSAGSKNRVRAVELQGKVIMSQEPEAGKIKSADGAGIVINLHH
ncbi:MAG: hypothetical protein O2966_06885 [Proteobacteria bacterium]|nr:hypothetical protein [Pseudomonadota bacterium]